MAFDPGPLPPFELPDTAAAAVDATESAASSSEQTSEVFAAEAERIAELATPVRSTPPSRHEQDAEEERPQHPRSDDLVQAVSAVRGSAARGTVLHKLLEEVLTGEINEDEAALTTRASDVLVQLRISPAADPTQGPCLAELAEAIRRTLDLPEVRKLRDHPVPEMSVLAVGDLADHREAAVAGFSDAVTLDANGQPDVVPDWKSNVAPGEHTRDVYTRQGLPIRWGSGSETRGGGVHDREPSRVGRRR